MGPLHKRCREPFPCLVQSVRALCFCLILNRVIDDHEIHRPSCDTRSPAQEPDTAPILIDNQVAFRLAALAQRYWADNQVSCTVTFDPETEGEQIANALDVFQYQLKGISFLPRLEMGAYQQMPYESIDEETYHSMKAGLSKLNFGRVKGEEIVVERFCDNDVCEIDFQASETTV